MQSSSENNKDKKITRSAFPDNPLTAPSPFSFYQNLKNPEIVPGPYVTCSNCFRNITYVHHIRCVECEDIDLCLDCFSVGVKVYPHAIEHPYRVIEFVTEPVFAEGWGADEEERFIDAVKIYGLWNWDAIAEYVGTKTKSKCESHYEEVFLLSENAPLPDLDRIIPASFQISQTPTIPQRVTSSSTAASPQVLMRRELTNRKIQIPSNTSASSKLVTRRSTRYALPSQLVPQHLPKISLSASRPASVQYSSSSPPERTLHKAPMDGFQDNSIPVFASFDDVTAGIMNANDPLASAPSVPITYQHSPRQSIDKDATHLLQTQLEQSTNLITSKSKLRKRKFKDLDPSSMDFKLMTPYSAERRNSNSSKQRGNHHHVLGFMPKRAEFEVEYDEHAEALVADLVIKENDPNHIRDLKIRLLEIYHEKICRRDQIKSYLFDRGVFDFEKRKFEERRRPVKERALIANLRVLSRISSKEKYQFLEDSFLLEHRLMEKIRLLSHYRSYGITAKEHANAYSLQIKKRIEDFSTPSKLLLSQKSHFASAPPDPYSIKKSVRRASKYLNRDKNQDTPSISNIESLTQDIPSTATAAASETKLFRDMKMIKSQNTLNTPSFQAPLDICSLNGSNTLQPIEKLLCSLIHISPNTFRSMKGEIFQVAKGLFRLPCEERESISVVLRKGLTFNNVTYEIGK